MSFHMVSQSSSKYLHVPPLYANFAYLDYEMSPYNMGNEIIRLYHFSMCLCGVSFDAALSRAFFSTCIKYIYISSKCSGPPYLKSRIFYFSSKYLVVFFFMRIPLSVLSIPSLLVFISPFPRFELTWFII